MDYYCTCCGPLFKWWKLFVRFWLWSFEFPCSNLDCPLVVGVFVFSVVDLSSFPAHPDDPAGTIAIVGSFPWFSAFRLGRFAGARRAVGSLPRLCSPCFWGIVFCWGFVAEPYEQRVIMLNLGWWNSEPYLIVHKRLSGWEKQLKITYLINVIDIKWLELLRLFSFTSARCHYRHSASQTRTS